MLKCLLSQLGLFSPRLHLEVLPTPTIVIKLLASTALSNIKDFTSINMWYERLNEWYNFSLGSAILLLMKTDNLKQLETLDPPFMKEIQAVVNDTKHDNISRLFGKI